MEARGTILVVRDTSAKSGQNPANMRVRVVHPNYVAPFGPAFVGTVLEPHKFKGKNLTIMYADVTGVESLPAT
jgi:hypothetical protein